MSDPYLGEIRVFGGNFAPVNWQLCDGTLLAISEYDTLFSLIGTAYGGDGQTTFAVPDLRSRIPVGQGPGPGLTPRSLAQTGGTETVTLTSNEMAQHNHPFIVQATAATGDQPTDAFLAQPANGGLLYLNPAGVTPTNVTLAQNMLGPAGGSQPHDNLMPTVATTYIIALMGIYPSRS